MFELVIASPFVTMLGTRWLLDSLAEDRKVLKHVRVLTDLSVDAVASGAIDPLAVRSLASCCETLDVWHLPHLHAKVYIADTTCAIVTSGNLTAGGLLRNHEFGLHVTAPSVVSDIAEEVSVLSTLGARVPDGFLEEYASLCEPLSRPSSRASTKDWAAHSIASDALMRLRLAEGPIHTVFERSIRYLLRSNGPMTTPELHDRICALHPDLCDDTIDRVIDGKSFGKKWKHAVRTAQQQLKRKGLVVRVGTLWRMEDDGPPRDS